MRVAKLLSLALFLVVAAGYAAEAGAQPPDYDDYLESSQYPIRVFYSTGDATSAQQIMGYAEDVWEVQIIQMGFLAPTSEDASGNRHTGLWIYIDRNAQYNHAEMVGDNPDTPWTDCSTRVIVNPSGMIDLELLIAHECNHALEMAYDCVEAHFAYENTTNAVTTLLFPDDYLWTHYFLPTYQENPNAGLDCTFWSNQDMYYFHYGAALFQVYLDERHGSGNGALLPTIWEAAKQNGSIVSMNPYPTADVPNDPDLMEAMHLVLTDHQSSLVEAFAEFARWRYFVGGRDDGLHFANGHLWTGCEVALEQEYEISDLPIENGAPDNPPMDYGSNYLEVDLTGLQTGLGVRMDFQGAPDVRWNVDALLIKQDGTADVESMEIDQTLAGRLDLVELGDYEKIVYVVSNVATESHNANNPSCNAGKDYTFALSVGDLASAPEITGVQPSTLTIGESVYVWVAGSGFNDSLTVEFSGQGVQVNSVDFVDENSIGVDVTVLESADVGLRDLVVTNTYGRSSTLNDAVELVVSGQPDGGTGSGGGNAGCGCTLANTHGTGTPIGLLLMLGLALGLVLRRRRPRPGKVRKVI